MENELTVRIKGLKILYDRADSEQGLRSVMSFAGSLQNDMELAEFSADEIYNAVHPGFLARYDLVEKYTRTAPMIDDLMTDVSLIYHNMISGGNIGLNVKYGYLLSVILTELGGDPVGAEKVGEEIRELVEISDDPASLIRMINAHGLRERKLGNFEKAIEIFSQVEGFVNAPEMPDIVVRHIANILNNRGLTKLEWIDLLCGKRGDAITSSAMEDLIRAGNYYLSEE